MEVFKNLIFSTLIPPLSVLMLLKQWKMVDFNVKSHKIHHQILTRDVYKRFVVNFVCK